MARGVILVVDDDAGLRELLADALTLHGFEVFGASDGLEALAMLREIPRPSLIILDVGMPRMNGFELVEELQALKVRAPIVVVTGRPDDDVASRFPRALAVLRKPFDPQALLELVERHARVDAPP